MTESGDRSTGAPATPRWVKILGAAGIVVAVLIVGVMLIGGGEHGPGRHAPTASGAALPDAAGGPAVASEAARTIDVATLDTMAFQPSSVDVSAGEVVTFNVTNSGTAVHEFTLGDAGMQKEHGDAMAHMPSGMTHELPSSITLQPGEIGQLTWRFDRTGTLEYACHEPGHYDGGMRGHLTVN